MTLTDLEIKTRLRDQRIRAGEIAPVPVDLALRVRRLAREQRRRRVALTAAGIAAALVFVGLPVLASGLTGQPSRGESAAPSGRTFSPSAARGLYALPPRGDLAGDEEWLAAVAALAWEPPEPSWYPPGVEIPDPAADTRRVAFAADVPSGRVALVLGMVGRQLVHAWFTGPDGAAADVMELATMPGQSGINALALVDAPAPSAPTVTLIVVTEPGDTIDRGLTPVVESSGEVRVGRVEVDVENGIGVAEVPAPWPWSGDVQIHRANGAGGRGLQVEDSARLRGDPTAPGVSDATPADPRGLRDLTNWEMAASLAGSQVTTYGLTAEQAQPTLLAAGPLGSHVRQYGELYGMTHPSGATSTWLLTYPMDRPDAGPQSFDFAPAPAGTALLNRVIAVQASAGLLVSAPAGAEAQALDASGAVLAKVPLDDGAGTASLGAGQSAVSVRILGRDGDVLAEVPVTGVDG